MRRTTCVTCPHVCQHQERQERLHRVCSTGTGSVGHAQGNTMFDNLTDYGDRHRPPKGIEMLDKQEEDAHYGRSSVNGNTLSRKAALTF